MENDVFFQKNIQRWSFFAPREAQLLKQIRCDRSAFCKTEKGELNLRLKIEGGMRDLYSSKGPVEEARQWISSLNLKGITVIYVYGVGLGYYYQAARDWLRQNENHYLIFLEDDPEMLHRLFETEMGTELLFDPQVRLHYWGNPEIEDGGILDNLCTIFVLQEFLVSALEFYAEAKKAVLKQLQDKIALLSNLKAVVSFEFANFGKGFFDNFFRNILSLPHSYLGNSLFNKFQGIPAIICGAGPSIEKNIHLLHSLRDKALIFAGGTALNVLSGHGIVPHFGVGIDPNWHQLTRLIMQEGYETPFFYRNRIYSEAFNMIHGDKLYVTGTVGYEVSDWFEEKLGIQGKLLAEGHNVVNFSLSIAHALGCNPIIFIGVDLAYTHNQSYASGFFHHPIHDLEDFHTKDNREELISKPDIEGKPVNTLWKWVTESLWFSRFASINNDLIIINSTEGGIGIPGLPHIPLKEVAQSLLTRQFDFGGWIHGEIQNAPLAEGITSKKIIESMHEIQQSLIRCRDICEKVRNDFDAVAQKLSDNKEVPMNLVGEETLRSLEKLNDESAYNYILNSFNENFLEVYGQRFQQLECDETLVDEKELNIKKAKLNAKRYDVLREAAKKNSKLIDAILKEHADKSTSKASSEIKTLSEDSKVSMDEKGYSYDGRTLVIEDGELGISFKEPFILKESPIEVFQRPIDAALLRQGKACLYYPSGKLKFESIYLEGLLHGPSSFFHEQGQLLAKNWFIKGVQQGKGWYYYPSGQLYSLKRFRDGLLEGRQVYYYPNGRLKSILNYKQGRLDGDILLYYPNAVLQREMHYSEGKRDGVEYMWNEAGLLVIEAHYRKNEAIGIARSWYDNGNLAKEVVYDPENKKRIIRRWKFDGSPLAEEEVKEQDYFDQIEKQTNILTSSMEKIYEEITKFKPLISVQLQAGSDDQISLEFDNLKEKLELLRELNQELGGDSNLKESVEQIWKTPSNQKLLQQQIEEMTQKMSNELGSMRDIISSASDFLKKTDAEKKKNENL